MDFSIYKHLMRQLNKTCGIPHYLFPSHNLISSEIFQQISKQSADSLEGLTDLKNSNDFFSEFPCYQEFDYNIFSCYPLHCGSGVKDMTYHTVNKKLKWMKKLSSIKLKNYNSAICTIRALKNKKQPQISGELIRYLKHFKKDPEPNFTGFYNWMYAGGNLTILKISNTDILIGADCKNGSNIFNIFKLNIEKEQKLEHKRQHIINKESPILQLCAKCNENEIFIVIRQKHMISFYKVYDINQCFFIELLWSKKVDQFEFFTFIDISENCHEILALDTKGEVSIYNAESKKKIFKFRNKIRGTDNWGQIIVNNNLVYLATRNYLIALDSRVEFSNPVFEYSPFEVINPCENICSITSSCLNSNYFYLGTTHHLIQLDSRNKKSVQRWTHLMKNPVQYLKCLQTEENDFLILQSCQMEETVGVLNRQIGQSDNSVLLHSQCLPRALANAKDALKAARLKGLCLSPRVAERFDFCVTGIQPYEKSKRDISLFTMNNAGDLFLSQISKLCNRKNNVLQTKTEFMNKMNAFERSVEALWSSKNCQKQHLKNYNLDKIRSDLNNCGLENKSKRKSKFYWECNEMYSEKSLSMYQDVMAQKILKVWGIGADGFDDDDGVEESKIDIDLSFPPELKVEEWMSKI